MQPSRARRPVWRDAKVVLIALIVAVSGAVVLASTGASMPVQHAVQRDCGEGGQLDVTGTWKTEQANGYTITWTFEQHGTSLTGRASIPPAEAARAQYSGRVGQVKGSIVGDKLDVVVQWPHRANGVVVRGRYVGTVEESAAGGGKVDDGRAWDLANPTAKGIWHGTGAAKCLGWPPLDDPLVNLASVSNGCGGESWVPYLRQIENWLGNSATYVEPTTGKKYTVNFKPACDLHDAGYSGAKVIDVLNHGKVLDYFGMSREAVDLKFRNDLRTICARTIKDPGAFKAANNCMSYGGFANAGGAQTLYEIVRDHAEDSYWKRPDLDGSWVDLGGHMPTWNISMQGRNVTAHYGTPTGWRGEYRGRLISYDKDGVVKGAIRMVKGGQVVKGIATLTIKFVHLGQSDTHFQLEYFMSGGRVSGTMRRA